MKDDKDAYTEAQAAKRLQIAEVTLRKWRAGGKIADNYRRFGRLVRYTDADILAICDLMKAPSVKAA